MKRISLKVIAAFSLALFACAASAQADYPNKPIRLIVAWPPASGIDTVARQIVDALRIDLGQPIIIDNRAGAAGAIAPPDGYTILFNSAAMNMLAAM